MTPTTVKLFSGLFFPTEWPSASPLGKKRFEKVSLTRTTLGADRVSASVTSRPRRMGMPRVWQKSGPTWFALMPISEKGPWGSTPSMVQTLFQPQPEPNGAADRNCQSEEQNARIKHERNFHA